MTEALPAVFGVAGVILGIFLRGTIEHRLWLREARQVAYADFVNALDSALKTADDYMEYVGLMVRYRDAADVLARMQPCLQRTGEEHGLAERELSRRMAAVELLGSQNVIRSAQVAKLRASVTMVHLAVDSPAVDMDMADAADVQVRWDQHRGRRREVRQRFLEAARNDLGATKVPLRRKLRRWFHRARGIAKPSPEQRT